MKFLIVFHEYQTGEVRCKQAARISSQPSLMFVSKVANGHDFLHRVCLYLRARTLYVMELIRKCDGMQSCKQPRCCVSSAVCSLSDHRVIVR